MSIKSNIRKERIKRYFIDYSRKVGRLKTPMDIVLLWLKTSKYLPEKLVAVEPFGMHGLWHTRDYAELCSYNEIFEIEKDYYDFLKKSYPAFSCRMEDSIKAIQEKRLHRSAYNFIVIDNPYGGLYGDNYCEHFDLFYPALDYLDDKAILVLNIVMDSDFKREVRERRISFYGKAEMLPKEALEFYTREIESKTNKRVVDSVFIPRNKTIGYLTFVVERKG